MSRETLPGIYKDSWGRSYTRSIDHGTVAGYTAHTRYKVPICDPCRQADRQRRGRGGPPRGTRIGRNTYIGMHKDLRKRRGRAKDHACPCGDQAQEWALKPSADIRIDQDGRKFSSELDDYMPMCRPCHRRMDFFKTHCPQGHALAGENLLDRGGHRQCLTCRRERQRVGNLTPEQATKRRAYNREWMREYYRRQRVS